MKLTIFGASGATGTFLLRQALDVGHEVTAVVRDPARLTVPAQARLHVITADFLATEQEIHASDLDWTIFRPPSLTSKPARGSYRLAVDRNLPRCFSITRADFATCMLSALDDPATIHRHICAAS